MGKKRKNIDRPTHVHQLWLKALRDQVDGFCDLIYEEQFYIAELLMRSSQSYFRHNRYEDGFFITYQELYHKFGRTRFYELNDDLELFDMSNWDVENESTRCYWLTPKAELAKEIYFQLLRSAECIGGWLNSKGEFLRSPRQAIASKDADGNTAINSNSAGVINPMVKVNSAHLEKMLNLIEGVLDERA